MRNKLFLIAFLFAGITACKINKKPASAIEKIILDEVHVHASAKQRVASYQPMETRIVDLLHTELHLAFDYNKQWVYGTAILTLKPYAEPIQQFELDAQGYTLLRIAAINGKDTSLLNYQYDSIKLQVNLLRTYKATDTLCLLVQYIAKPNEIKSNGGKAISDSRGLYFINPLCTDPNKPRQIWSQGETEYNSCWFPTVDAPNEKHTQDFYLTVEANEVSLSNGLLLDTKNLANGKHIDHWQQLKPHAPYLSMIAIGEFVITKDKWRNMEVSYYLEPAYAPYARTIFGKTPQMIETFSKITGVDYPWDKFSQIICRDFVSGAMENTSAVLHYEMVQHTDWEHIDNPHEDIIVHELFHHWFGDLVTCRSWSNLPLNESFATYGEYLYNEATYGKNYADMVFSNNLAAYLRSRHKYKTSPNRKYYVEADEVFDVVSYQKGSWILHQLRNEIGDTAFFKGINLYLTQNAFGTTDLHHLRHAMEIASGKDLQLFFKQWFEGFGHPNLNVAYEKNDNNKLGQMVIQQIQDSSYGVFDLHTQVYLVWQKGNGETQTQIMPVHIQKAAQVFQIPVLENGTNMAANLLCFWIDPKGNIPGLISEKQTLKATLKMFEQADGFQVKKRAITVIGDAPYEIAGWHQKEMIQNLLTRNEDYYQLMGLDLISKIDTLYPAFEAQIIEMALHHPKADVRDNAMFLIASEAANSNTESILVKGLNDSSYNVMATSLQGLSNFNEALCLNKCKELEGYQTATLQRTIAWLYANLSQADNNDFFNAALGRYGFTRGTILNAYGVYLKNQNAEIFNAGIQNLASYYNFSSDRNNAKTMLNLFKQMEIKSTNKKLFEGDFYLAFKQRLLADLNAN